MSIPADVHFVWIGPAIPWAYVFAILSAAGRGGIARVTLHHTEPLADGAERRALEAARNVRFAPLDPEPCLRDVGRAIGVGEALVTLHRAVPAPVARADILRAAILFREGGIYLDLDTVTVATLRPLLDARQFVGTEFIVWPDAARASRSLLVLARHVSLDLLRKVLKRAPGGWKAFRKVERFYPRSINNAVMGAEPGSLVFADYLRSMTGLPIEQQRRLYALGPRLLQKVVGRHGGDELAVKDPQVFYPLPPEISEHWFRTVRRVRLHQMLPAETCVVHWYASIRSRDVVARVTPGYVRKNRERQFYSALVHASIKALPEAA